MTSRFGNIHSFYQTLELTTHLPEVIACGESVELAAGDRFQPAEGFIYFVLEGKMTLAVDDEQNLLGIVIENMPLGLLEYYCPSVKLVYQCLEKCRFTQVAVSDFERIFFHSSPQYMKELAQILVYMSVFTLDASNERGNLSGFQTIKSMLSRYLYRSEIDTGKRESLSAFIIKRTNLSRSYVYQVLAALKAGGYITVKKGQLISIDRKIPEKF
ncbi:MULTISPECIES: helix-turn-helix domain-containing protein [Enterobacteriaceae]|uniref:Helix-turn-helix domain-containing protein n=1 Tax=Raoultella lignicola TaxID=3040939 RepID=A0ABU9FDK7_9ENTR|nr:MULTISPECIES: helix-turn-helix domain-containing protein [Enterobacteriaceae]MRT47807.1 Crp/Fnr family transcriptional regulator [Raoultella sp. RIT712]QNK05634.1 helix-turn-helix domain-containing protein [Enterobacter sp. JUb54]ROS13643.1 CRP-like cAMP-binding protein [Raoultella sp. BIGb0399]